MSLAFRVLVLVALALLPPLAIQAWTGLQAQRGREEALRAEALAQTRAVQADVARIADGARQLLVALAEAPVVRSGDGVACNAYLTSVVRRFQTYVLLAANTQEGPILCNSLGTQPGAYSNAGRAYLSRALATGGFVVGDLVRGVQTNRNSIHFALPFLDMDGRPGGIVLVSIDQHYLVDQLVAAPLPKGSLALLLDPSGTVVAGVQDGQPVLDGWVGRPASEALRRALRVDAPSTVLAVGPDGRTRLFGALPPDPELHGMVVAAGLDQRRAFSDLQAASRRNLAGICMGAVLALLAAVFGARRFALAPLSRLAQAAERVGRGDWRARADLGRQSPELRQVGATFDRMADALAAREAERDRALAAQQEGEARLARMLATVPAGVVELDGEGRFVYANAAAERMLDAAPGGLIGSRLDDAEWRASGQDGRLIPADRLPTAWALRGEDIRDYELALTTRAGRPLVLLVDMVPLRDADGGGAVRGALSAFQDVTARIAAVRAMREGEARFRHMADSAPALIWMTGPDGRMTFANMHFEHLFGRPAAAFLDGGWREVMLAEERGRARRTFLAAFGERRPFRTELRVHDRDGQVRWLLCAGVPRLDDAQAFLGYTGCAIDVTEARQAAEELERRVAGRTGELSAALDRLQAEVSERQRAEAQLVQAQKMEAVGQLTGGIAHDFNNMLQAIGGSLDMMQRRIEQGRGSDAERYLNAARQTLGRTAALTARLLAFARRQTLQPEIVRPAALIEGLVELIRRTVGASVTVALALRDEGSEVRCDPSQLENALLNLAINARDAMPDGGRLTIALDLVPAVLGEDASGGGDRVRITVSDTGGGMDETTRAHAFEPFFTTKPIGQGTGLGLSQLYGFVQQSGGEVRLVSAPGRGTAVEIDLPRHVAQAVSAGAVAAPGGGALPHAAVLLVEDEADVRSAVRERLEELGFMVLEAADGPGAIEVVRSGAPLRLLVTDVGLPGGLNGRQVADAARERHPELPVLFITGFAGLALDEALGPAMTVLSKPFGLETLASRIEAILAVG